MSRERRRPILAATMVIAGMAAASAQTPPPLPLVDPYVARPRVIVMTDIANEPDDQMSAGPNWPTFLEFAARYITAPPSRSP